MKRSLRTLALPLVLVFATGCYGQFALTKKVHKWNGSVTDNKFVHSLLFWAMVIVPVYEVVGFVDAVFFNVVEFWAGSNLIDNPNALATSAMADGSVVFATAEHRYRIYPQGRHAVRIFVDDEFAGRAVLTGAGEIAFENQAAGQSFVIAANDVEALTKALPR